MIFDSLCIPDFIEIFQYRLRVFPRKPQFIPQFGDGHAAVALHDFLEDLLGLVDRLAVVGRLGILLKLKTVQIA